MTTGGTNLSTGGGGMATEIGGEGSFFIDDVISGVSCPGVESQLDAATHAPSLFLKN